MTAMTAIPCSFSDGEPATVSRSLCGRNSPRAIRMACWPLHYLTVFAVVPLHGQLNVRVLLGHRKTPKPYAALWHVRPDTLAILTVGNTLATSAVRDQWS